MNVSDHTQRVFDSDLGKLTQMVAEMGGLAQKQVTDSIDALARHDVEVVILDIEMPVLDGMAALPLLLRANPGVKVIMAASFTITSTLPYAETA